MNDVQVNEIGQRAPAPWNPMESNCTNWCTMDIPELWKPIDYLKSKRVVLATVTKDMITFLRLHKLYPQNDINIIAIFDITLDYRPNVKAVLQKTLRDLGYTIPIFTDMIFFRDFCDHYISDEEHSPIVIKFDHSGADERQYRHLDEHFNMYTFNEKEFENHVQACYLQGCEAKKKGSNEFVYMMELANKLQLNSWFVHVCRCYICDCYGDVTIILLSEEREKSPEEQQHERAWVATRTIRFKNNVLEPIEYDPTVNLYELQNNAKNQKVRFVFSSDFGGGKMTYCLQQDYQRILSKDVFAAWFNPMLYYGPGGVSSYMKSELGYVFDGICRYELEGNTKPIYIKMEGRLDRYFFDFLRQGGDGTNHWGYFHLYFKDYEFHMIVKDNEDMEVFARDLAIFMKVHLVDPSKVRVFQSVNHCEYFTELSAEKILRTYSTYYDRSTS